MNQLKPALSDFLNNIRIVLTRTSHLANIGPATRTMKTMGLSDLVPVTPNLMSTPMMAVPPVFDPQDPQNFKLPEESLTLASGATDILHNVCIMATLGDALADTTISCVLTSRRREIIVPLQTLRKLVPGLLQAAWRDERVALVSGNETFGLSIEEAQTCNRLMIINGDLDYFPFNPAQAMQVICYEAFSQTDVSMTHLQQEDHTATHEQIRDMVTHMESVMSDVGFFNRRNSKRLMCRVQGLFGRANTQAEDIDILHGFFNTISHRVNKKDRLKAVWNTFQALRTV